MALALIFLTILFCTFFQDGKSCVDVCPLESTGWSSLITASARDARHIYIAWTADTPSSIYVVQYRLRNTQLYTSSFEISSTDYNITQLIPEANYEVQVCRAASTSSTDDCGNCLLCISTEQAQEPSSPPVGVQVRADSSESITVFWKEPEITNGVIRNYSVLCFHTESGENIINETVPVAQPVSQFFLEPSSTYSCQVIAYNDHGPSLAQQAVGTTLPVTTVASLLLVVYADGVEFAELTVSAIQSNMLTYERLLSTIEDTKIRGLDYHFYRKEVYMTQNNHRVTRFPVVLNETTMLNSLRRTADPEMLFNRSDELGSIVVDWVNNELYWVERQLGYRIMRAIINSDGSVVGPFCVVSFTSGVVTHMAIDPNHGYLYWSGSTVIYRASLNSVRLNSTLESCASDISSKVPLINNTQLETFTIEPNDAIYYIGFDPCFETNPLQRTNRSILGTPLNTGAVQIYTGVASPGPVVSIDSFDRILFATIGNNIITIDTSTVATCPNFPPLIGFLTVRNPILSLRTFQSVKQPLPVPPGPPTDILVSTTSTEAIVTWKAPLFIGELFSDGAFANWIYVLNIRAVRDPPFEDSVNTSALTFLFENLQPETLYEIIVSASGPGGNQTAQDRLVFSTKSADSANFTLLVASADGVYSAKIDGTSARQIDGDLSVESNGVAYDSYTGDYYWSVEGGQGKIYISNSTRSFFRRNPFSLKLDWVARRLFWVEDGPTVRGPKNIVSVSLEDPSLTPEPFAEVMNIQATVLDSLNGLLFWANDSSIHATTLSGLVFESVCYTVPPGASPFGFAMDARRRRLYWLNDRNGGNLVVNQLEYTSTACNPNSIVAQDVVGLSFSSSSTVMAYAADNLFIGSLTDSRIYTIASDLSNVGDSQVLALGVIELGISIAPSYKDLIVVSKSLQILPDTLRPTDRQRSLLTPSTATSPPRLSDRATSLETIIEWDPPSLPAPIQNTLVLYLLQYSLLSSSEVIKIVSSSTSVTLEGIPPETTLTAMVTAHSLWYQSASTQSRNITSKPALPGTVSNVRAYVYKPTRGSDDLTALVLWDEPQFVVSNYLVSMFQNGQPLYPPSAFPSLFSPPMILYQSPSADTHYIVSARDFENRVNYFLTSGQSYQLQITANNPSGAGTPSQTITLNVTATGPDYPQNFITVNESGVHLSGVDAELNHALPSIARPPVAIDTISRIVYWYLRSPRAIARQSLNSASMDIQPYLPLPDDTELLAMAFEWVGMDLYYMLRDQQNSLQIMKISTVNKDMLAQVGPVLQEQVSPAAMIKMVIDPFGGYLHWLVMDSAETNLHRMNLRNTSSSSRLTVQSGSGLTTDLRSLNLSSALLLDPLTSNLLLSDADSGDIVNCSIIDETCVTFISANTLQSQPGCGGTGLPARSIALNEQRLYWIGVTSSCIFAIELNDPTNLLVVSHYGASDLLTLSPGQQPLPTQDCLSPDVLDMQNRPVPDIVTKTNTSATMRFMSRPLEEHCNAIVLSHPPVTFGIIVERREFPLPGFPIFTFEMEYTVDGLLPFTEYEAELSVSNMYTMRRSYLDALFSSGRRFITLEGVPSPPTGVTFVPFGTADIQIRWAMPNPDTVRGPGQTFYVQIFDDGNLQGELQVDELSVFVNASVGVVSGHVQDIVVIVSNEALNSTGTRIPVIPWPLVPPPVLVNITDTTIAVKVVLNDTQKYEPVTNVSVKICRSNSTERCDCSQSASSIQAIFKSVETSTEWTFMNLQAQVQYCVQSVGIYRVVEGFRREPEITCGESILITTGVPGTVTNIRAYVYKPTRGSDDLTALVLWDEPQFMVSNYIVSMFQNGQQLYSPPATPSPFFPLMLLYQSPSADTHYIVSARDFENRVNYFLTSGQSYQLQITANNPSGAGLPSQMITLNVAGPNYPQNFMIVNESGIHLAGIDAELNHALPANAQPPVAVDTISRFVYWYLQSQRTIARQSLNSANMNLQPYLLLPDDTELLAMAFEWVGMDLYYMLRVQQNSLQIMKISAINKDVLAQVGPVLQDQVSPAAMIKMVVDPFGGYLHWLVVDSAETSLHQMNLRNTSLSGRLTIQSGSRLTTDLRSLNLSSALLLDPLTNNLLLSDADSGDIVNCSVVDESCATLISANALQPQPDCGGTGLPAHSIALNEQHLYWIGFTSSCIFAIELNDPTNIIVVSNYGASDILTLSPGQQPLPTQDCLSPNVSNTQDQSLLDILVKTNTSATMKFMSPSLDEHCNAIVISHPPVTFGVDVKNGEHSLPGFPIFTFEMEYTVDGLLPFTEYKAELSVSNMYTIRKDYLDALLSSTIQFTTLEGVPSPPTGVSFVPFGTADIQIRWAMPNPDTVRGPDQTFYVQIFDNGTLRGELQVDELSVFVNASVGVISGLVQDIVVIVSNNVLNSTGTRIPVTPWPLVPQPVLVNKTNTTITVKVVLNDTQIYEPVTNVGVKICHSNSTKRCDCSQSASSIQAIFKSVEMSTEWTLRDLQAQVQYCVQSIGIYRVVEGFRTEPEITCGESILITTEAGVPDPPEIRLRPGMEHILEWNTPLPRGGMILFYKVEAIRVGALPVDSVRFVTEVTHVDLSTRTELTAGVVYRIQVFAVNNIGESNRSNEVEYTRLDSSMEFNVLAISIGSTAGVLVVIILCVVVVAVFLSSCCCHWRKDHELSNLRDAHAHTINPGSPSYHTYTDKEIELQHKA